MGSGDDTIDGLRDALRVSPNNLPLRQHLADMLCGLGRYEEAEAEYKAAIGLSPENDKLKIALARAFFLQGKNSAALVIVEEMLKKQSPSARRWFCMRSCSNGLVMSSAPSGNTSAA